MGVDVKAFNPVKELSKFMIIMAMAAIGLNSNVVQLIKNRRKAFTRRRLVPGRNYRRQPYYAAYYGNLVNYSKQYKRCCKKTV